MGILDSIARAFTRSPTAPLALPPAALEPSVVGVDAGSLNGKKIRAADEYSANVIKGLIGDLKEGSFGAQLLLGVLQRGGLAPRRGTQELLVAYRRMPNLRSVVGRIAQSVAAVNWRLYASPKNTRAKRSTKFHHDPEERRHNVKSAVTRGDLREIETHPFLSIMDAPNPEHTGVVARRLMQVHLELKGESFLTIDRNKAGGISQMWPIPPHWIIRTPEVNYPFFQLSYLGIHQEIPEDSMWWIRDADPEHPYARGQGIGESLGDELDADEYAAKHLKSWFLNRGMPAMMVGIEGVGDDELDIAEEKLMNKHGGPGRNGRVHLHNGTVSAVRLDDKFADMELVDLRTFEASIVRETFNMPPEIVGHVDSSNRATAQAAKENMSSIVVVPRLEFLRAEFQQRLLPAFPDSDRLVVDYDDPMPADRVQEFEALKLAPWSITVNEWRKVTGHVPLAGKGGDMHPVPVALTFQADLADVPPPATPAPLAAAHPQTPEPPIPAVDGEGDTAAKMHGKPRVNPGAIRTTKAITPAHVASVLEAIRPAVLSDETSPIMDRLVGAFGQHAIEELGVAAAFNRVSPLIVQHLADQGADRIQGDVDETTRDAVRDSLIEGASLGESIPDLASRIEDVFAEATESRATTIARTEVQRSANFARWQGQAQTGIVDTREWLTAGDGTPPEGRTRPAHEAMNGQRRSIDEAFQAPGGEKAMYPGDFKDPSLTINCRCATIPIIEAERTFNGSAVKVAATSTMMRTFTRETARFESEMIAALQHGFRTQEREVKAALARLAQ